MGSILWLGRRACHLQSFWETCLLCMVHKQWMAFLPWMTLAVHDRKYECENFWSELTHPNLWLGSALMDTLEYLDCLEFGCVNRFASRNACSCHQWSTGREWPGAFNVRNLFLDYQAISLWSSTCLALRNQRETWELWFLRDLFEENCWCRKCDLKHAVHYGKKTEGPCATDFCMLHWLRFVRAKSNSGFISAIWMRHNRVCRQD